MANITRYDPLDEMFGDLLKGFFVQPVSFDAPSQLQMKVDVAEDDSAYTVLAEVPGVKKEDINVSINGNQVSISAEVKKEHEVKNGATVLRSERCYGKFSRSFTLAGEVDEAAAQAKYADGVLELKLPKKAQASAKRLSIQ